MFDRSKSKHHGVKDHVIAGFWHRRRSCIFGVGAESILRRRFMIGLLLSMKIDRYLYGYIVTGGSPYVREGNPNTTVTI